MLAHQCGNGPHLCVTPVHAPQVYAVDLLGFGKSSKPIRQYRCVVRGRSGARWRVELGPVHRCRGPSLSPLPVAPPPSTSHPAPPAAWICGVLPPRACTRLCGATGTPSACMHLACQPFRAHPQNALAALCSRLPCSMQLWRDELAGRKSTAPPPLRNTQAFSTTLNPPRCAACSCGSKRCLHAADLPLPIRAVTHKRFATLHPPALCSMELWRDLLLDFMAEFAGGKPTVLVGNSIGALACLMVRVGVRVWRCTSGCRGVCRGVCATALERLPALW